MQIIVDNILRIINPTDEIIKYFGDKIDYKPDKSESCGENCGKNSDFTSRKPIIKKIHDKVIQIKNRRMYHY